MPQSQELTTRLGLWNKFEILQHSNADEFADAFLASEDADDLEDDVNEIVAACKALFEELSASKSV